MKSDHSSAQNLPVVVTVPCFSGAPWDLEKLKPLSDLQLRTMRLPEEGDHIEVYVDFVAQQVSDLTCYVLVGDSFGAVVSLAFATRRPACVRWRCQGALQRVLYETLY